MADARVGLDLLNRWFQFQIFQDRERKEGEREKRIIESNRATQAAVRGGKRAGLVERAYSDADVPLDVLESQAGEAGLTFQPGQFVDQATKRVSGVPAPGQVRSDILRERLAAARGQAPGPTFADALDEAGLTTAEFLSGNEGVRRDAVGIIRAAGRGGTVPQRFDTPEQPNIENTPGFGSLLSGAFTPESRKKTAAVEGVRRQKALTEIADRTAVSAAAGSAATEPFTIAGEDRRRQAEAIEQFQDEIGDAIVVGMRDARKMLPSDLASALGDSEDGTMWMLGLMQGVKRGDISPEAMESAVKNAGAEIAARYLQVATDENADMLKEMIPPALLPSFRLALLQLRPPAGGR